ncbi:MAG: ZIP family metal transporter, partial [Candidatus Aenigmatarchaeota archaeon]
NFPEGIAVLFTSLKSLSLGLPLALAIAIHNIPEGMAISIPICHATGSRNRALGYSLFSGLSQPLGALIAFGLLYKFMSPFILDMSLSFVAGIMVFISFHDLIPVSREFGSEHISNVGLFLGMIIMVFSLYLV